MTTSCRIAPAGHRVKVTEVHSLEGRAPDEREQILAPGDEPRTFYVHSGLKLRVEEMGPND